MSKTQVKLVFSLINTKLFLGESFNPGIVDVSTSIPTVVIHFENWKNSAVPDEIYH